MSYKSPIEVIQTQMQSQIEGEIYKAVVNVGINVDKEELLKALQYDRNQYQKGYEDRDNEIIRCGDCKKHYNAIRCLCGGYEPDNWFCGSGERKERDQ